MNYYKPILLILILLGYTLSETFAQELTIEIKNNHPNELKCKSMLETLMQKYDLKKWCFSKKLVIDYKTAIPHSHPVLTLNTRHIKDEELFLSTFIHEQLHWYLNSRPKNTYDSIMFQLKKQFPQVPVGYPFGGNDTTSTYVHLIINYLEIMAMKELLGELKASQVLQFWMEDHYTWIYQQIHNNGFLINRILNKNGFML